MLEMAVMDLPENQRTLIVLRDIYNFPMKEIARMLDISEENVRVQLHRARKALRKRLEGGENGGMQRSSGTNTAYVKGELTRNQMNEVSEHLQIAIAAMKRLRNGRAVCRTSKFG